VAGALLPPQVDGDDTGAERHPRGKDRNAIPEGRRGSPRPGG
jgi:hypothetical protein